MDAAKETEYNAQTQTQTQTWIERELQWALSRVDELPTDAWNGFVATVDYETGGDIEETPPQNASAGGDSGGRVRMTHTRVERKHADRQLRLRKLQLQRDILSLSPTREVRQVHKHDPN